MNLVTTTDFALGAVVLEDGLGLLVVSREAARDVFGHVIRSSDEGLARDVICNCPGW